MPTIFRCYDIHYAIIFSSRFGEGGGNRVERPQGQYLGISVLLWSSTPIGCPLWETGYWTRINHWSAGHLSCPYVLTSCNYRELIWKVTIKKETLPESNTFCLISCIQPAIHVVMSSSPYHSPCPHGFSLCIGLPISRGYLDISGYYTLLLKMKSGFLGENCCFVGYILRHIPWGPFCS